MPGRFLAGVGAVIQREDGRFLLLQRSTEKDFAAGVWECVTGRLEQGEGYEDALVREVFEETGLTVRIDRILDTTHFYRGEPTRENELVGVLFLCTTRNPKAFGPSEEHVEHRWVTTDEAMALLGGEDPSTRWMRGVVGQLQKLNPPKTKEPVGKHSELPTLKTERLILRPFVVDDADRVEELVSDKEIAATTLNIPHPYPKGGGEKWIATHPRAFAKDRGVTFAVTCEGELVGAISLQGMSRNHRHAELGYWIGKPYWGKGYATEAARAVISFAFDELNLIRVHAHHMAHNAASGRVMEKCGMLREGMMRQHVRKWDEMHDVVLYGIVRNSATESAEDTEGNHK